MAVNRLTVAVLRSCHATIKNDRKQIGTVNHCLRRKSSSPELSQCAAQATVMEYCNGGDMSQYMEYVMVTEVRRHPRPCFCRGSLGSVILSRCCQWSFPW